MDVQRRKTKAVSVGNLVIGGGAPVVVQTMLKTNIIDLNAALEELRQDVAAGAQLIRFAVPDERAARNIGILVRQSPVPLVADIHFDPNLALIALESGVSKLRLNPGTIKDKMARREIVLLAKEKNIPIRIGLNTGSLPLERRRNSESLVDFAVRVMTEEVDMLRELSFENIVLSIKSSDPVENIAINRKLAQCFDYPIHLGVTEAGQGTEGLIYSVTGMAPLLLEGIGDTIRVSLNGPSVDEVEAAYHLLRACGVLKRGVHVVACPTCGRLERKTWDVVANLRERLKDVEEPLVIAVMGCMVNGPQEASRADIGVALGKVGAVLFKKGQVVRVIKPNEDIAEVILSELKTGEVEKNYEG
ncbi:flavodoxin-dependent (E)-4-hydroxy-3-methylbut-2-enyl-diphosphate synthase [Coprothermobacter proteolyticus]|nr:flavodoxin-dependent (E)-4-hydroxy-3-methylbut-2-enyl-diphosphate synthase [Coprothermobacter proteolyticus]